jgi:Protein-arginine deiminase (PAD)
MTATLTADLLVDTNRDRRINAADNIGEDVWVSGKDGRGAIVLPNLDRDNRTTRAPDNWTGGNFNGLPIAPNNVIDNAADLNDIGLVRLAKLQTDAVYEYRLTIRLSKPASEPAWFANNRAEDRIRLFMPTRQLLNGDTTVQANDVAVIGPSLGTTIVFTSNVRRTNEYPIQLLEGSGGFFFGIEGIRSGAEVRLTATLEHAPIGTDGPPPTPTVINRDTVAIKVAPFIVQNHTQAVDRAIVENLNPYGFDNSALRDTMRSVFGEKLIESNNGDLWQQDGYEIGYVQAPYGSMTVVLELPRAREYFFQPFENMRSFVRGKLLAPGVGVSTELADLPIENNSTLGGDIDSIKKPNTPAGDPGYLLLSNMPDFMKQFFVAQNVQEIIDVPLEWLSVNHVDEVIQQASDGKRIMIADPDLAWALLIWSAKLDPNVRLHANMNGNEFLPGHTRQGVLATSYLSNEELRRENLEYVQRPANLPSVSRIIKQKLGLAEEVSIPQRGLSNMGTGALRKAGVLTQFLGDLAREFRVRFVDANRYVIQYRDTGAWSVAVAGSRLKDEVFGDAKAFLLKNYWQGEFKAGDTFTFQSNPSATLVKMPVMFSAGLAFSETSFPIDRTRVSPFSTNHVNSLVSGSTVITGAAYGPIVNFDGTGKKDLFQDYARRVFHRMGYRVVKFTDSRIYHNSGGSIHCGTNAIRLLPVDAWWTT